MTLILQHCAIGPWLIRLALPSKVILTGCRGSRLFTNDPPGEFEMTRIWAAIMLTALGSCAGLIDTKDADAEVSRFHRQLNAGEFKPIYAGATDDIKKAVPEDKFTKLLDAVHRKLGSTKSATQEGSNVITGLDGKRTTLSYKTQFDRGAAVETFVFREIAGKPVLAGYNINSDDLITN